MSNWSLIDIQSSTLFSRSQFISFLCLSAIFLYKYKQYKSTFIFPPFTSQSPLLFYVRNLIVMFQNNNNNNNKP